MPTIDNITIAYIHLGKAPCRWLIPNALRTLGIAGHAPFIISDQRSLLDRANSVGLNVWQYEEGLDDGILRTSIGDSGAFRQGFWLESARRFLALREFCRLQSTPVVHIESDVIPLSSGLFEKLGSLGARVAYGMAGSDQGSGAVVLVHDAQAAAELAELVIAEFSTGSAVEEMTALSRIAHSKPNLVTILPTLPSPTSLLASQEATDWFRERASTLAASFNGVLDVSAVGQFLLGMDPRNERGRRRLYRSSPFVDIEPQRVVYRLREGKLLVIEENRDPVEVLSLHVHSKDLRAFHAESLTRLLEARVTGIAHDEVVEWDPWGLWRYLQDGLRHRLGIH